MSEPIRNRVAEEYIQTKIVTCKVDGCNETMQYSQLKLHVETACQAAEVECKYKDLLCKWKGQRRNAQAHESTHVHPDLNIDELLSQMKAKQDTISLLDDIMTQSSEFENLIACSNITGTIDLNYLWHCFDIDNRTDQQITKTFGDVVSGIKLTMTFELDMRPQDYCCMISYQVTVTRFPISLENIRIAVLFSNNESDDMQIQGENETFNKNSIGTTMLDHVYETYCREFIDITCNNLEEADQIIKAQNSGTIKIFAHIA